MTIKYDRFAFTPQICYKCGRKFIWERYKTVPREAGIEHRTFGFPLCKRCIDREKIELTK